METKNKTWKFSTRMERNLLIWRLYSAKDGMKIGEIAREMGLSYAAVWKVVNRLKRINASCKNAVKDYFDVGLELSEIFKSLGEDSESVVTRVLTALWLHEYASRAKIRKMTNNEFEEFLSCKQMFCAGIIAHEAMMIYRKKLRKTA